MKFIRITFASLLLTSIHINAQDNSGNNSNDDELYYQTKTSKGTRTFQKVDYKKVSLMIQMPISNHQSSALGSRGTRLDLNSLPATSSGSINVSKPLKSRGTRTRTRTRSHDNC